jgi:hypothetical protein
MPSLEDSSFLIITPESAAILATLERHYPGGRAEAYSGNSPDELAYYVFHLR